MDTIQIVLIQYIVFGIITQTYPSKSLSFGDRREVDAFFSPECYFSCDCYPSGHPVKCVKRVHGLLQL